LTILSSNQPLVPNLEKSDPLLLHLKTQCCAATMRTCNRESSWHTTLRKRACGHHKIHRYEFLRCKIKSIRSARLFFLSLGPGRRVAAWHLTSCSFLKLLTPGEERGKRKKRRRSEGHGIERGSRALVLSCLRCCRCFRSKTCLGERSTISSKLLGKRSSIASPHCASFVASIALPQSPPSSLASSVTYNCALPLPFMALPLSPPLHRASFSFLFARALRLLMFLSRQTTGREGEEKIYNNRHKDLSSREERREENASVVYQTEIFKHN